MSDLPDGHPWPLLAIGVVALLAGAWPLLWMVRRALGRLFGRAQRSRSWIAYGLAFVTGVLLVGVGVGALALAALLGTYRAFTKKTHVAEVQAFELAPHRLRVYVVPIGGDGTRGESESYDVDGDQWQVGGDVLRFRPFLTLLGVPTVYRLTRVEGRWERAADANIHFGTAHDRAPPSRWWHWLYRDADAPPLSWLVAGAHGQSVAQLPDRRAIYDVYVTPNGYVLDKRSL